VIAPINKSTNKPKRKVGRPTKYSKALAGRICARMASGESLRQICRTPGMPAMSNIFAWTMRFPEFQKQYERAREFQAAHLFEEILDICDDGQNDWMERELKDGSTIDVLNVEHVQRSRLRIDTRKWYLSKVLPKKYADSALVDNSSHLHLTSITQIVKDVCETNGSRTDPSTENRVG
jgi:hypothetical protein